MQKKVVISLSINWPEASRLLPKRLVDKVVMHLQIPSGATIERLVYPNLGFDAADPLLSEFLAAIHTKNVQKILLGKPIKEMKDTLLLRQVFHFTEYTSADLLEFSLVQITVPQTLCLARPLSQFYQVKVMMTSGCGECGEIHLLQQTNLKLDEAWPSGCDLVETDNYELLISDNLRTIWQDSGYVQGIQFQPVAILDQSDVVVWQVQAQQNVAVQVPPTPLQVLERCPGCDSPLRITPGTVDATDSRYVTEATFYVKQTDASHGDFWQTPILQGRPKLPCSLLESHHTPEASFVRTGRVFWVLSNRLIDLFQRNCVRGWLGKPVFAV